MYLSGTLFLVNLLCLQGSCAPGYNDHDTVNHEAGQSIPIDNALLPMSWYSAPHVEPEQETESSKREKKIAERKARKAASSQKYYNLNKKRYEYNDKLAEKTRRQTKSNVSIRFG